MGTYYDCRCDWIEIVRTKNTTCPICPVKNVTDSPECLSPLSPAISNLMRPESPRSPRIRAISSTSGDIVFTADELLELHRDGSDHVTDIHSNWLVCAFSLSLCLVLTRHVHLGTNYEVCIEKLGYTLCCGESLWIICISEENSSCESFVIVEWWENRNGMRKRGYVENLCRLFMSNNCPYERQFSQCI